MKLLRVWGIGAVLCGMGALPVTAQEHASASASATAKAHTVSPAELEKEFFVLVRQADEKKFLSYVSEGGVNVGREAQHLTRTEVEEQMARHSGLYCKLFDSSCIQSEIRLDESNVRACSYRELLTKSKEVHTAATETTRNGVKQAILVARVKNDDCSGVGLVDFIFNLQADGWKLFSIP